MPECHGEPHVQIDLTGYHGCTCGQSQKCHDGFIPEHGPEGEHRGKMLGGETEEQNKHQGYDHQGIAHQNLTRRVHETIRTYRNIQLQSG